MAQITDMELREPAEKLRWITDPAPRGHGTLTAKVSPDSTPLFYYKYTNSAGDQKKLPMGAYNRKGLPYGYSLKEARLEASRHREIHRTITKDLHEYYADQAHIKELQQQLDAAQLEQQLADINSRLTLRQGFEKWLPIVSKQRRDGDEIRRKFEKDLLPALGDMAFEEIRRKHIVPVLDAIVERDAASMAKNGLALLRQLCAFALEREWIEADPTSGIKKSRFGGKSSHRTRYLSEKEIREFSEALSACNMKPQNKIALWIQIGTLTRIGEVLKARWADFDFEEMRWTIPESHDELHNKTREPHSIPLSPFVQRKLEELRELNDNPVWLYPNREGDSHIDLKTVTKQVTARQLSNSANVQAKRTKEHNTLLLSGGHWVPHDLRRTGATLMAKMRVQPVVIERCLAHAEQNLMHKTYQQYQYQDEMREAWMLLGERLEILTNPSNLNILTMTPRTA